MKISISIFICLLITLLSTMSIISGAEVVDISEMKLQVENADLGTNMDNASVGFSIPSESSFISKLENIKKKYPNGGTWAGTYYENGVAKAWTCHGYACQMIYEVFGAQYYKDGLFSTTSNKMGTLNAGDLVRINSDTHSIFITKVTSDRIYFTDANGTDKYNEIRWDASYSVSEMKSKFSYKMHLSGNNLTGNNQNNPEGYFESATPVSTNQLKIKGWAFDKDNPNESVYIDVYAFKNRIARVKADKYREDIGSQYGVGNYHGFEETITMPQTGTYNIAVYAINIGGGKDTEIYYHSVTIPDFLYKIESITESAPDSITIKGWAFDKDDLNSTIYLDVYAFRNRVSRITANKYREDIGSEYGVGNYHGFEETIHMPHNGTFNIAIYMINDNNGKTSEIYYQPVTIPMGMVESVTTSAPDCITLKGWAFDSHDPSFNVYIDVYAFRNRIARITANKYREDIGSKYGVGNYHGFEETIHMPKNGTFNIAVYALNNDASKNVEICYQSVTIPSEEPKVLLGDADGSGEVEITDATIIQRLLANLPVPYPDKTLMNADVDGDGELSILDVTFLQRHLANITVPYSIGEPIT